MKKIYEGNLDGTGIKFAIVASRFNNFITDSLLKGAEDALKRHCVDLNSIDLFWVPGAFEIPLTAKLVAETNQYDAVICLGAVIRGATVHFDYVAGESAKGITQVALSTGVPLVFGLVTTDTIEQAIERAGTKAGNKGAEASVTAIELVNLHRQIRQLNKSLSE